MKAVKLLVKIAVMMMVATRHGARSPPWARPGLSWATRKEVDALLLLLES